VSTEPGTASGAGGGTHRAGAAELARRILAFAGLPLLSLLAPFLFLPALARLAGADAWVAVALGQSVGGFVALVAGWGYPTLAPPRVAIASESERRRMLATSMHVRVPVWLLGAAIGTAVAALLAPPTARLAAALMAAAMSLAALAPTWFWIGVGRVAPIVWLEVVPRMVAALAATGILLAGGSVLWYPVLVLVSMLVAPLVVTWRVAGAEALRVHRDDVRTVVRHHPPGVIAETAGGLYNALAVTIVTAVAPTVQAARYVAGDKVYRVGQYGVSALGNALQGWVVQAAPGRLGARLRVMIALHLGLGVTGLVLCGLLGSWVSRVVFGGEVAMDAPVAWGFGLALLGIALGTAFGRIGLISLGARRAFMFCVVGASAVGVVSLALGGAWGGGAGAAWALGGTETASALAQGVVLWVVWRSRAAVAT